MTFNLLKISNPRIFGTVLLCHLFACQTAYYSAWERLGKDKRDLLKSNVIAAREEQKEASEQFKNALERLQESYGKSGTKLETVYSEMKGDFEESKEQVDEVKERIAKVDTIANDLFKEWRSEIDDITDKNMQRSSLRKLEQTKTKYQTMFVSMKKAEAAMEPVVVKFNDTVLYLKHNLNAQSLGALQKESKSIEADVQRLLAQMNASLAESDEFIKTLE